MIPNAPWILHGEAIVFLASPFRLRLLVNYYDSPVGSYLEHALAEMTVLGPHISQMSVNWEDSRRGGREIWGFPKVLELLRWKRSGSRFEFRRGTEILRLRAWGPHFPLALSFWTVQFLDEEPVRVPGRISGKARLGFRGRQVALILDEFELKIEAPHPL
ncbi:MAG: hypothetical protein KY445_06240 [Armatimonadetes bacterium]|nr:hypothetical protein [Armatimonadota bacterium]